MKAVCSAENLKFLQVKILHSEVQKRSEAPTQFKDSECKYKKKWKNPVEPELITHTHTRVNPVCATGSCPDWDEATGNTKEENEFETKAEGQETP